MDFYQVKVKDDGLFAVIDNKTGQQVFSGGKTAVEEWLDWKENQLRWEKNKNKHWFFRIFDVI